MNVPEVIESLRASCSGSGIVMAKIATPATCRSSREAQRLHVARARLVFFGVYEISGPDIEIDRRSIILGHIGKST